MTYALYLTIFLGGPLLTLCALTWRDRSTQRSKLPFLVLLLHVLVAVVYTTPWDNYLVATQVWWYDPARVFGMTFGWVPLEEYAFFMLQTAMTGLWLIWLAHGRPTSSPAWRWRPWLPGLALALAVFVIWLTALAALAAGWQPGAYLALELAWFLPPIALQLIAGADILWQQRRLVLLALVPPIVYLSVTDSLAIGAGVWTISPQQTLGVLAGGVLPIEEIIFFTLTNVLIVFGILLMTTLWRTFQIKVTRNTDT